MNTANLTSYSLTESIASTSSWREAPSLSLFLSLAHQFPSSLDFVTHAFSSNRHRDRTAFLISQRNTNH